MIRDEDVFKIGHLAKPHGIKGEVAFLFTSDIFDIVDCPYLICNVDGILVPFFVEEYRFKGEDVALMKFEDIDNEDTASKLSGYEVYFPKKYQKEIIEEEQDFTWHFFIGYKVIDKHHGYIGDIDAVDDSTMNTLLLVKNSSKEYLIPATEDFIDKIDTETKTLYLELMHGLVDLATEMF